ncbi:flagellar export protein FliJ [Acetobacterium woodii]|uniref:Flagellar export protein FliJ n=1 Tax=Acetobacterium woodii (strain ATCC 29683 / DSM 1030 / JCM 2381 / KCTC 1655 / WB1) TaxID=931626 RepID=H6LDQ0_ACEWD|nr:flagellar export protein FliJ [Acetobacterium woodii]AFA49214.1 flagellar export protein FliJ [Acetobacterium woodii DSM 1030]
MKKFQFQLGKLLSYKDQNLENEMMILGGLTRQLSDEMDKQLDLEDQQEKCRINYERDMANAITPTACQVYIHYMSFLKEQIKIVEKRIDEITEKIDLQIEVVKGLKLETRSLEIVKENKYDEYKKEMLKETEKEMEEFITTRKIMKNGS